MKQIPGIIRQSPDIRGFPAYRSRQWPEASRAFEEVLHLKPGDRPAQVFLERCRSLAAAPPAPDWQGVFILESK